MNNEHKHSPMSGRVVVTLCLVLAACTPRADRISLHDPRLPIDARRWLADAEDEVSIAAVELDEAEISMSEAREFRRYAQSLRWPGGGSNASQRLDRMVEERITLAQLEIDLANQRVALAEANLVRARAETAVRHDIGAYNLDSIVSASDEARERLDRLAQQVERQRAALDEATSQFWESYGTFARSGNGSNVLWTWEGEEVIHH